MTPDAVEFAKSVLWHLASIQADVYKNQILLAEVLSNQTGQDVKEIRNKWDAQAEKARKAYYEDALKAAKLSGPESF